MSGALPEGAAGMLTAFVSHPDPPRHDTGWRHPEHQGRLPALVRAVYKDMLTLHGHLLEVEGRVAEEEDLRLVHTSGLIARVREASSLAEAAGESRTLDGEVVVSGASWEAACAATGCALTGVDVVLSGEARNAFVAVRPPGHAAHADAVGGFSLFNHVAVAARHLRVRRGVERVLVVEWGGGAASAIAGILGPDAGVRVLAIREAAPVPAPSEGRTVTLPPGSDGGLFNAALEGALQETVAGWDPGFVILAAGFDILRGDPLGGLAVDPADIHAATALLRSLAEERCGGRLVSILEGGYDPAGLGRAAVQHIRALASLPPA